MKQISAILLALLLLLSLCACGGSDANEALYGTYKLYAMDYDADHIILAGDFFSGENYVTLKSGGSAEMCLEDEKADVKWKADGKKLTFSADDGDMEGSLSDGILTLSFEDTKLYFLGDGAKKESLKATSLEQLMNGGTEPIATDEPNVPATDAPATDAPATEAPVPADTETEVQKLWNGWWYGCADINGSEGGWEFANGMTFDVAMLVELDADGTGSFGIYDPYGEMAQGENNNRFVFIQCHADSNYLYGDSGKTFGYDINPSDWVIVRNLSNNKKLNVGSSHTDEDGNKMGYDFTFLPWGDRWQTEDYRQFLPHFNDYLAMLDAGKTNPYDDGTGEAPVPVSPTEPADPGNGELSPLLGANPTRLDVNDRGVLAVYYPADQFQYDDWYGKLKNETTGVGILMDPMLGATNLEELRASYEEHNSQEDDYALVETTVNGYKALILKYSDWLGSTMRVDIDFGGSHDGWYGISFAVSGDSLADCDSDLVWAIIHSMELLK